MRVVDTTVEAVAPSQIRVVTIIDLSASGDRLEDDLGEGPTGDAVPDRIVRYLIDQGSSSVGLAEIQKAVGGNPATVNRQAWTLANNAPDLQRRLRGWVVSTDRGRYALSPQARRELGLQTDAGSAAAGPAM